MVQNSSARPTSVYNEVDTAVKKVRISNERFQHPRLFDSRKNRIF